MVANLTRQQLAERADTAQPSIARWESGRTAVSLDTVSRLVHLCGLDLHYFAVERDEAT